MYTNMNFFNRLMIRLTLISCKFSDFFVFCFGGAITECYIDPGHGKIHCTCILKSDGLVHVILYAFVHFLAALNFGAVEVVL